MIPVLTIIAGPNGVGKSTLIRELEKQGVSFGPLINPDEIKASLSESMTADDIAAARYALVETRRHIRERRDFSRETTLSGREVLRTMADAKSAGFTLSFIYLGARSVEETAQRVAVRAAMGGHDIPYDVQKRRFSRSIRNAANAMEIADRSAIFENSANGFRLLYETTIENGIVFRAKPEPNWLKQIVDFSG